MLYGHVIINEHSKTMKSFLRILTGIILPVIFLCSCGRSYTLDIYGNISGMVSDSASGEPLPAAQVTLVPGGNTVQTSADGTFSFSRLDEGKYTVSVQKSGYQANRKDVTVVSGETADVVVPLTVIPNN